MTSSRRGRGSLDIYLQPAVVGGGLGDIEEVLAVGRRMSRLGWTPFLYRRAGRPLPKSVEGPWGWPSVCRVRRLAPRALHALTVTPWWGVSAAPDPERSGPPGAWSLETGDIEATYGRGQVVHLSLEEFARTLTSREQSWERWREGGAAVRTISRRLTGISAARDLRKFHSEYRKWRAFDRPNVLHLFTGFHPSRSFAREFPEAVQSGPLWPESVPGGSRRILHRRWIWYASPSTSDRLATLLGKAASHPRPGDPILEVEVRGPRPFSLPRSPGLRWRRVDPTSHAEWTRRFHAASLRIATGSRTLLEAIAAGGPFLYFNGAMNQGRRTRRHRPEKIDAMLEVWRRHGVSPSLRHDLADFSRLRRVSAIVQRAARDPRWSAKFPPRAAAVDYPREWADAGRIIDRWVSEWAGSSESSTAFVARWRASGRYPLLRL
jgi:hypothetical protein